GSKQPDERGRDLSPLRARRERGHRVLPGDARLRARWRPSRWWRRWTSGRGTESAWRGASWRATTRRGGSPRRPRSCRFSGSSFALGYRPSHFKLAPLAAAMFSLDATVLTGSSLLVVTLPALRPDALILMVAGIVAFIVGRVQLDATASTAGLRRRADHRGHGATRGLYPPSHTLA